MNVSQITKLMFSCVTVATLVGSKFKALYIKIVLEKVVYNFDLQA